VVLAWKLAVICWKIRENTDPKAGIVIALSLSDSCRLSERYEPTECDRTRQRLEAMMTINFLNLPLVLAILLAAGLGCNQLPITTQQAQQTQPPLATPTSTPDETNEKLLEKLEELEKKIDDQQKQAKSTPPPTVIRTPTRAWVNSPGDGFLALRSEPSADIGYRMLQIPHGAEVRVLSCQSRSTRIGGRNGRWCRLTYDGTTGWAFDAWLIY
jgi:hypothetical protein